jgi:hypothetical protein
MSIEVMRQALELLEDLQGGCTDSDDGTVEALTIHCPEVIANLRAAIEQAAAVAWMYDFLSDNEVIRDWVTQSQEDIARENGFNVRPLYTAPHQWVELTDDEARALVNRATFGDRTNWQALVYMVDAKLKEKNA